MREIVKLKTGNIYEDKESFSRLVMIDDLILMSNTAGRDPATKIMPDSAGGQMTQCFANVERVLQSVGASLADIVRSRLTVADVADVPAVMEVVAMAFKGIDPVSSVTCAALGLSHLKVEIEVTAIRGASASAQDRRMIALL